MEHISIRMNSPIEFVNITEINPQISKCQIKVCYVGDEPNRNGSVITKEVAKKMANSLPGSPIVGFYDEEKQDFDGHNQELVLEKDSYYFKSVTQPYGFVDIGAKVWFEKFLDDGIEHEYLMTEGYLWTGRYPETKQVLENENPQSMELDDKKVTGHWTKNNNDSKEFFIINEAIMSALCILGVDVEPCFEGAAVSRMQFSFDEGFKTQLFELIEQMKEILQEGGTPVEDLKDVNLETSEETPVEFEVVEETPAVEEEAPIIEEETPAEVEETPVVEEAPVIEEAVQYNLEEIPEYVELTQNFTALEAEKTSLQSQIETLEEELSVLRAFKLSKDREEKQTMIDNFYMLTEEDKADVVENIDNYSLDEIEAKLSVLCVRNKVSFNLEEDRPSTTFSLDVSEFDDEGTPAWIKAVQSVAKEIK